MRTWRRVAMVVAVVSAAAGLGGCAGSGAPAPTVPELTYAGAPGDEPSPTGPAYTVTAEPTATSDDDVAPSANPAIDDLVRYAAIGDSEITGEWHGGCAFTPSVGLSGMTWRGRDLAVADGRVLSTVTMTASIRSTAADGTHEVESFSVHGVFAGGGAFEESWTPEQQAGEVYGSWQEGVSSLRFEGAGSIDRFELRAYCD